MTSRTVLSYQWLRNNTGIDWSRQLQTMWLGLSTAMNSALFTVGIFRTLIASSCSCMSLALCYVPYFDWMQMILQQHHRQPVPVGLWSVVSVYLFIPIYLTFLGPEAYGLIGFYTTLLGVLAFTDLGLTATLNREMARLSVRQYSRRPDAICFAHSSPSISASRSRSPSSSGSSAAPIAEHWLQLETSI